MKYKTKKLTVMLWVVLSFVTGEKGGSCITRKAFQDVQSHTNKAKQAEDLLK